MSSIINTATDEVLVFDVSTESWSLPARVSDHPLEEGSDISDHIQAMPKVVRVNATVSATPFAIVGDEDGGPARLSRAQKFYDAIQPRDGRKATLLDFVSDRYGTFNNMLAVNVDYSVEVLNEISAVVTLKQVNLAFELLADLPFAAPRADDAKKERDSGKKPKMCYQGIAKDQSWASSLFGFDATRSLSAEEAPCPSKTAEPDPGA